MVMLYRIFNLIRVNNICLVTIIYEWFTFLKPYFPLGFDKCAGVSGAMDSIKIFELQTLSKFSVYVQDKEFGKPGNNCVNSFI